MKALNLGIAQINPKVGDLEGNFRKILSAWEALDEKVHLICFPELSLSGYPPEDLLLRKDFLSNCQSYFEKLLHESKRFNSFIILGLPYYREILYNSAALIYKGECLGIYHKRYLPEYSVFDERRYFKEGRDFLFFEIEGIKMGFFIGEDIWYLSGIEKGHTLSSAEVLISLNASPYTYGEYIFKENFLKARAKENRCYVIYVNLVGGQDELVFDGRSLAVSPEGKILARAKAFEEDLLVVSLCPEIVKSFKLFEPRLKEERPFEVLSSLKFSLKKEVPLVDSRVEENPQEEKEIYLALKLALKDYFYKNGFKGVILGLSGGIDSALVAVLAVDVLGKDKVWAIFMPNKFTSKESFEDARELAKNLGLNFLEFPINRIFEIYQEEIKKKLGYKDFTVAEENLQARIRANLLFYLSNREGYLVLATSNKSEAATGYGTIYGDMAGGFAPLKDIYKSWVYKLASYRNSLSPVIPERIFKKAPSAELRLGQTDQDTLPPYEILDQILQFHLEEGLSPQEIVEKGFSEEIVKKVFQMLKIAEYKRRQTPCGPKITKKAFGKDYRMPITCGYL